MKPQATTRLQVWINAIDSPRKRIDQLRSGDASGVAALLFMSEKSDTAWWSAQGYAHIGHADVSIELLDDDTVVGKQVETLRVQQTNVMAEAQRQHTRLEQAIQSLLAIDYKPTEAGEDDIPF